MGGELESGELEIRKIFEEVTTKNVMAAINFSNETRRLVKELETKVKLLEDKNMEKDKIINDLRLQISNVLQRLYREGIQ